MSDTAELREFADICRALAEGSRDPGDKASWSRLALKWEQMESADASPSVPCFMGGLRSEAARS
jgi:hypothetical protein